MSRNGDTITLIAPTPPSLTLGTSTCYHHAASLTSGALGRPSAYSSGRETGLTCEPGGGGADGGFFLLLPLLASFAGPGRKRGPAAGYGRQAGSASARSGTSGACTLVATSCA